MLLALPAIIASAQKGTLSSTPNKVQAGFKRDHPDEGNANWEKSNGDWRASYKSEGRAVNEYYNRKGQRSFRRTEWDRKKLSATVDKKIRSGYDISDYKISRIERPKNPALYEVKYTKDGKESTVYTDENGNKENYHTKY